jgi:hypothetical protein
MNEKTFVERYEELVKENESLKARLVAMDRQLEHGEGPLRRIFPVGDFAKVFSESVNLDLRTINALTARQGKEFVELEAVKQLGIMLAYRAYRDGYVEMAPKLSENTFEAHMALVKLK